MLRRHTASFAVICAAILAAVAAAGTADAQTSPCTGIDGCVVVPASPVTVVVTTPSTTYVADCPAGTAPTTAAASAQAGVMARSLTWNQPDNPWSFDGSSTGWAAATLPATPAVTATPIGMTTVLPGTWANGVSIYTSGSGGGADGVGSVAKAPLQWGPSYVPAAPPTMAEIGAATGVIFDAATPEATATGAASGSTMWGDWTTTPSAPWGWLTPASFTPSIGCLPAPAARAGKTVGVRGVSTDRNVKAGTRSQWLQCPAGTTRVGHLRHAVYVTGRNRLTVNERRAIDSRIVVTAGRGEHVETRLSAGAPSGVRVQIHAACRG